MSEKDKIIQEINRTFVINEQTQVRAINERTLSFSPSAPDVPTGSLPHTPT